MKQDKPKRITIYMLCFLAGFWICGCSAQKSEKITHVDTAMGTIVQQTLYIKENSGQIQAMGDSAESDSGEFDMEKSIPQRIMSLLDSLERDTLSWRMEGSEIYRINMSEEQEGYPLSDRMQDYLGVIGNVWEKSNGALDVTIGEVTRLWDIDSWAQNEKQDAGEQSSGQEGLRQPNSGQESSGQQKSESESSEFQPPAVSDIQAALEHTGFEKVRIDDGRIYLAENMQLDLGAVGKGIACDEVLELLQQQEQVTGAVVSIGGSILTYGEKPDGSSWKIGIQHPREEGTSIAMLQLKGSWCVSTSGDYERYVEKEGVRYHHIMDPESGFPADSGIISVTIVSESGCLSDALSTACFVLGKDAGRKLAEEYGAEAYIIDSDGKVYMTEGMDKMLILQ